MKSTIKLLCLLFLILTIGCNKDENMPLTASFPINSKEGVEKSEQITIAVALNEATNEEIKVKFSTQGDALLNGDYRILTPSPITIGAGQNTGIIKLEIIDDNLIEGYKIFNNKIIPKDPKHIILKLENITGNGIVADDPNQNTFTYSITDFDPIPENVVKTDLFWKVQGSDDIDEVNLNLYALTKVVIKNNIVEEAEIYKASKNKSGFESLTIDKSAPDREYYIAVEYKGGNGNAEFNFFSYKPSGGIYGSDIFRQPDSYGESVVYGPITTKSGDEFSRGSQHSSHLRRTNLKLNKQILSK